MLRQFLRDERGATAISYGIMAALISIVCVIAFRKLGLTLTGVFMAVVNAMP